MALDNPQQLFEEPEYRVEGPLKVTGAARYTADVQMPGMLWLAYTRSPRPHSRIVSVETSAARQVPRTRTSNVRRNMSLPSARGFRGARLSGSR